MTGTDVLAHGVGGRQDLPLPFEFALVGAGAAVAVSFVVMAVLWRTSRLRGDSAGRPVPARAQAIADHPVTRGVLRAVGLAGLLYVAVAAVFGPNTGNNPTAGFIYVFLWVGLVPASLLFGPAWRLLNPLRTIHAGLSRLVGNPPEQGLRPYPSWLGYWPAAAGLFAFTWLELVAPGRTSTTVLVLWFAGYLGVQLLGSLVFGSIWFGRGDAFEVFSTFIGRLAPIGRRTDGRLVVRNPLDGLDGLPALAGIVAVVAVLLGSTAYDSFSEAPVWVRALQSGTLDSTLLGTFGLAAAILVVAGLFSASVAAAGRFGVAGEPNLPRVFAHSLVPIAVGYLIAHYFSLLLFEGQRTLILASDPLGTGANLFGTAELAVNTAVVSPTTIAVVQVLAIVTGHIVGVVAAHDRAARLFSPRTAVRGQMPLLVLMIAYTVGGLGLLFAT
jgi:hypothetical protein